MLMIQRRMCSLTQVIALWEILWVWSAYALPQQAMSNDKPLRVYALFLKFSVRRCLTTSRWASTHWGCWGCGMLQHFSVDIALGEILGSTRSDDKKLKLSIDLKLTPLTPVKMANVHH